MPKYEYACKSCGDHIEVVQSFKDEPLTECPSCGGVLRKVFGAPGISFKGSGFYRTDNRKRRQEPKVDAKSDTKADAKSDSSGGGSSEGGSTKEAAKTESPSTSPSTSPSSPSSEAKPKAAEAKTA